MLTDTPTIQCPACERAIPVSIDRYPLHGGTFTCPSCHKPLTLAPRAEFLASWQRRETGAGGPLPGDRPITVPSAVASSPGWRVALHGGGIEEVTVNDLRIRIRQREVVDTTEVSPPGTDQWVRAIDRPELAGLLRVAKDVAAAPKPVVPSAPVESVRSRAISGWLYPISDRGVPALVALSIVQVVPVLKYVVGPATWIWILAIIRESARGERNMPSHVASDLWELFETGFKMLLVSLVTLLPIIGLLAGGIWSRGLAILTDTGFRLALTGAALISLVYYPASLATVAVWEHALPALDPFHVVRVIRIMRADYAIAVLLGAAGVCAGSLLTRLASPILDALPFVGSAAAFFITTWAAFWAAHLLGWAVHRHVAELGWN